MPVMQIHGTVDATVPYAGNVLFQPIESVINYWIQFNNCDTIPMFNAVADIVTTDNCIAEHYVYEGGDNGVEVEFYKIIGGGHSWPGAPININTTNMDFSASKEIWRFFRKYRLSGSIVSSIKSLSKINSFQVYPNPTNAEVNISFSDAQLRTIAIVNAMGQLVNSYQCKTNFIELALDKQGLYFITIQDALGNSKTSKVVKY